MPTSPAPTSLQLTGDGANGDIFIAGGDNYVNGGTTNTGNNNSNIFSSATNSLARGNNLNRPRWYSTSTTLLNGEIYVQGGSGGGDLREIRDTTGGLRLLSNVNTGGYSSNFPRNFLAPDGRIFGFDNSGKMYYVTPGGAGLLTPVGQLPGATSWTASAAMFQPGRIIQMGGASSAALVIDINGTQPVVTSTQSMSTQRQWVSRVAGRQGARHRRQLGREPAHGREQQRRDLEPRHRNLDGGSLGRQRAPVSRIGAVAARCIGIDRGRRRAWPAEEPQRRNLLPALPVRRHGCARGAAGNHFGS
jgi:hypothetical protein